MAREAVGEMAFVLKKGSHSLDQYTGWAAWLEVLSLET